LLLLCLIDSLCSFFFIRLFCEEIDIGEDAPRRIASGLREHYSLEEMQGRKLIVVCNLKEAKLVGFVSQGMSLLPNLPMGKWS
jgi:tRNA-binding EMAP/Myf-like protein